MSDVRDRQSHWWISAAAGVVAVFSADADRSAGSICLDRHASMLRFELACSIVTRGRGAERPSRGVGAVGNRTVLPVTGYAWRSDNMSLPCSGRVGR